VSTPASSSRLAVDAADDIITVTAHRADTYRIRLAEGLATDGLDVAPGAIDKLLAVNPEEWAQQRGLDGLVAAGGRQPRAARFPYRAL